MDGIIIMHTQLSQSITAFSGHDLGLSMRLNVAMPLGDVAESVTSGLLSISDVGKPSET